MTEGFRWQDGDRLVRFGRGALADAPALLPAPYVVLTTERASANAPTVVGGAAQRIDVGPGRVDELAGALLERVGDHELLVALGGGRVIDTAKALASARPGVRVAAIPTTLSAAEMTAIHRRAAGAPQDTPGVRPAIVLNDPALSASQPEPELAASTANALSHALEGPLTPSASPVPTLAAREAARLLAAGWSGAEPDRDTLALGALLSGWTIDSTGYGLHHVASQTLVRIAGVGHGQANAAMLPHTLEHLRRRDGGGLEAAALALGADPVEVASDLARRAGTERLRDLGVTEAQLDEAARAAAQRPQLAATPPAADEDELRELYTAAW